MAEQMESIAGIENLGKRRIVIIGAGFAGLKLAKSLRKTKDQIVLIDKNNYHQFQPLFYQVATAGLEPSAISFPLRKALQNQKNISFRLASLERVDPENQMIYTDIGSLHYDILVLALGADTNFFGNANFKAHSLAMKSTSEALNLRNTILSNFEMALNQRKDEEIERLLNMVVVGGGPTGVELAGALAEMKKYVLPKDYPELNFDDMSIYLIEAGPRLLNGYSEASSEKAVTYLTRLGVKVSTDQRVTDYDGKKVTLSDGEEISTETLIWAAGIKSKEINGIDYSSGAPAGRITVNAQNQLLQHNAVYAIGDLAFMRTEAFPDGHPQVAQVAIQQADLLAKNLIADGKSNEKKDFKYKDKGSLATIGRNLAVADLPFLSFQGIMAWLLWLFVHLMSILGVKNRLFVFINWAWSYFTYDQSLRLLIKPKKNQ